MKKLILLFTVIFFAISCKVYKPYILFTTSIDYSQYAEKGFFFSEANSVMFDYTPIGSLTAYSESGDEILRIEKVKVEEDEFDYDPNHTTYNEEFVFGAWKRASAKETLNQMYEKAIKLGADGIINLKIKYQFTKNKHSKPHESYTITGMAIKRN